VQSIDILIADDDPYRRYDLRRLFHDRGFAVFEAPDAAVALDMLGLNPKPLLVLLATLIPVMSAIRMLEQIASDPALAPLLERHRFILMSTTPHATRMRVERLQAVHSIPVLGTPVAHDQLVAAITAALDSFPGDEPPA
jgi:CheY-like chemotaxis protein